MGNKLLGRGAASGRGASAGTAAAIKIPKALRLHEDPAEGVLHAVHHVEHAVVACGLTAAKLARRDCPAKEASLTKDEDGLLWLHMEAQSDDLHDLGGRKIARKEQVCVVEDGRLIVARARHARGVCVQIDHFYLFDTFFFRVRLYKAHVYWQVGPLSPVNRRGHPICPLFSRSRLSAVVMATDDEVEMGRFRCHAQRV